MLEIEDPRQPKPEPVRAAFALWNLGFRPFYLLASLFAALSISLWMLQFTGHMPAAYVRGPAWHGHEMLYGYTMAVVAGFLLTAVRNWTGKPTPEGAPLMALAALWIAGRVLVLTPYATAAAIVNAAFPVAVAIGIGIPIVQSRNPAQLLLRRPARADGLRRAVVSSRAPRPAPVAGAGDPAGGPRRHPLHRRRDGRAGDADVHQQRRAGNAGHAPPRRREARPRRGARIARGRPRLQASRRGFRRARAARCRRPRRAALPVATLADTRTPIVWVLHAAYGWIVIHLALRGLAAMGVGANRLPCMR